MKVLLIITDLYLHIGGGQTVYRKIVESSPGIDFYYFRENEDENAQRPANAKPIPLRAQRQVQILSAPPFPHYRQDAFEKADRFVRSVEGMAFDIVDIPDFQIFGVMLREAFERHDVKVGRTALAMHGNISVSMDMEWGASGQGHFEKRMLEKEQFESADGVYAISNRYIKEWQSLVAREVLYIDPLHFVDLTGARNAAPSSAGKPDLYCIGRMERRKGNDLFIELARWLDPALYGRLVNIGEQSHCVTGVSSQQLLEDVARKRGLHAEFLPPQTRDQLRAIFKSRSTLILPVRYDTLNLLALEAIFSGCPVALSSEAGACDYLDERFPGLPYVKIDFNNFYGAAEKLNGLLQNYDGWRAKLEAGLGKADFSASAPFDMEALYQKILEAPVNPLSLGRGHFRFVAKTRLRKLLKAILPLTAYRRLKAGAGAAKAYMMGRLRRLKRSTAVRLTRFFFESMQAPYQLRRVASLSENSEACLRRKLAKIYESAATPFCRVNFWLDIARIERLLGNDLMAVTYELRTLRLLGEDKFGLLPRVISTLREKKFEQEARAAEAMYGDPQHAEENVYRYLEDAKARNRAKPELPFEKMDDRRSGSPKVSVIASLYNAAPKLKLFLTCLMQQTLLRQGLVEIILIDSGSPGNEGEVVAEFLKEHPLNLLYARSAGRETIQAAWNRGIRLAKAPYLVFLGADETLYPEALETLMKELDASSDIDWAMGDSLVTEVDARGIFQKDIMSYSRRGGTRDHVYLETCYLSWVGGMYRKSLHDRFGYYDETFGAAGDTEFKNRILPDIKVRYIPETLGLFLNYPDGQTTASPRAEIEDLRAWYIHRTPGGVRYAFENRPDRDAEELFYLALSYRKSYCGHISSDIDYAAYLAQYLASKQEPGQQGDNWAEVAEEMQQLLNVIRSIECIDRPLSWLAGTLLLAQCWRVFYKAQARHRRRWPGLPLSYKVFNDNRYEQHSWLWKSV